MELELKGISYIQQRGIPADSGGREKREERGGECVQDTPLVSDFSSSGKTEP